MLQMSFAPELAAGLLGLALVAALTGPPAPPVLHEPVPTAPQARVFPPARPAPRPAAAPMTAEQEIANLGRRAPVSVDSARDLYRRSGDLYAFMNEALAGAAAGERASEFYVYLALGQCQTYLRLDAEAARALDERVMLELDDRPVEERRQWQAEYERCRGFAGGSLDALRKAMGADTPGAEIEYGSIWFQRAVNAGYPPALAEAALRINLLAPGERVAMLEEAVASGDPEVYWTLFFHSPAAAGSVVGPAGMAWLIEACRTGYDCTSGADWFHSIACLQEGERCEPDESAIGHYWDRLSVPDREQAMRLAAGIERDRGLGRFDGMPWPTLTARNLLDRQEADAGGG